MPVGDWTCEADYDFVDRLDVAGLAWEFARRDPRLIAAAAADQPDLSSWGLAAFADPTLTAEQTEVWWSWKFAPGVVVRFVEAAGSGLTVAHLRECAAAGEGTFLRFPNGLRGELPGHAADPMEIAVLLPLDGRMALRAAAARSIGVGLTGRWRTIPLPPRWRRLRLRRMLRALDARAAAASWRQVAQSLFGRRFRGSTGWRDSSERAVAIRLAAAGRALVDGGYAILLRRRAVPKG